MSTAIAESNGQKTGIAAGERGLQLTTLDDMWRFADIVFKSGLAPKGMESAAKLFVAIEMGAELGLKPMAAIQNVAVINGRPSVWGDAMLAVVRSGGQFDEGAFDESMHSTGDAAVASCTVRRLPNGKPQTRTFSVAQAKRAGLWGKNTWNQYPERMLQMRARAFALRDVFADYLRGCQMAEELQGIDPEPTQPRGIETLPPVRASSLDVLTERISDIAGSEATNAATKAAERMQAVTIDPPEEEEEGDDTEDPLANLGVHVATLTTIGDVQKLCDEICGPDGTLSDDDSRRAERICQERIAAIRGSRGGKQGTLIDDRKET